MSKEIQQIIEKLRRLEAGEKAILATVVDVEGSGYRRPGARMLIDREGYGIGTVSGGCLEADVLERAKKVFETAAPQVIKYDTTQDENSVFGLGMGCRGIVSILLETISTDSFFFNYAADYLKDRKIFTTATMIKPTDGRNPGQRLFFDKDGVSTSDFDDDETNALIAKARAMFCAQESGIVRFEFGEVFVETIKPPLGLKIFGAGFDALPVINFAKEIGWRVSVVDHRPAFADPERLARADEIFNLDSDELPEEFFEDENAAAIVMTHNYERDKRILPRLLRSKAVYIGALGPKKRTERLLDETGETFNDEQLARLYAPVGLDIGADTPETIALSIIAEIQAVLKEREGRFLRERKGSIYDRKA